MILFKNSKIEKTPKTNSEYTSIILNSNIKNTKKNKIKDVKILFFKFDVTIKLQNFF